MGFAIGGGGFGTSQPNQTFNGTTTVNPVDTSIIPFNSGIGANVNPNLQIFSVTIPGFPESAIPMTRVIPRIYFDDAYDATTVSLLAQVNHYWSVQPNSDPTQPSIVVLIVEFAVEASIGAQGDVHSQIIPAYVDIDLVFFNENIWNEINTGKS